MSYSLGILLALCFYVRVLFLVQQNIYMKSKGVIWLFSVVGAKTSGYLETSGKATEVFTRVFSMKWMKPLAHNQIIYQFNFDRNVLLIYEEGGLTRL